MSRDMEMTVPEALRVLRSNGLISAFDLQFAETLARNIGAEQPPEDIDRFRIIAAMASHLSFTRQSACIDVETSDIGQIFPDLEDDAYSDFQSKDSRSEEKEKTKSARDVLIRMIGENRSAMLDRLSMDFPQIICKAEISDEEIPFVPLIWNSPRLYLQRFWSYEKELADMLVERSQETDNEVVSESEIRGLCTYFEKTSDDGQWKAVQLALRKKLSVMTGGPGTGKTTIVSVILARILKENPLARIALCAPTGKAQARMLESIRNEVQKTLLCDAGIKSGIAELPASTIHRLLKYNHHNGKFRVDAESPLETDVLIVDEASMVSLPMMVRLMRAVPKDAKIILLGDADQLASVETGAVLADICELARQPGSTWNDNVAMLTASHRFKEGGDVDRLKAAINRGAVEDVITQLSTAKGESLAWGLGGDKRLPSDQNELTESIKIPLKLWEDSYLKEKDVGTALKKFNEFQILCSHRGGLFGINSLNKLIRKSLRKTKSYAKGVPVMITRNNYEHRLFNGDVGLCWPDDNGNMKVHFPDPEQPGKLRKFSPSILPEHEDSFAMTVHKAQGSGFGEVLLILPDNKESPILTRELLYTGVTRAIKKITIWGTERALRTSISKKTVRASGLKERLKVGAVFISQDVKK